MYSAKDDAAYEASKRALEEKGYVFQTVEESRNNPVTLRKYGRRWRPSDDEEFHVNGTSAIVNVPYTKSNGNVGRMVMLHMWSSRTGWDLYPVSPFGFCPDVESEIEQLRASDPSRQLTGYIDDDDRAAILIGLKDFTVKVLHLHGATWKTDEEGNRIRVPDSEDKLDRAPFDYYQVHAK